MGMGYRWSVISSVAAAAVAAGLAGCGPGASDAPPSPVVAVQAATVGRAPIEQWIHTQAVLFPLQQAIITPKVSAPVARFYVQRGQRVRAGELLAELENHDLAAAAQEAQGQLQAAQAAYETAVQGAIPADLKKAQLDATAAQQAYDNAEKIYQSRRRLFQQGAIAQRDLNQARVDATDAHNALLLAQQHLAAYTAGGHAQALQSAQAALTTAQAHAAAAEAQLAYTQIRSPMDGVVTDRPVYPGELATPSAPLMTIMNLSQVVARTHLPAAEAAQLKAGDRATLSAPGLDHAAAGRVTVVSPATDPGSTTVEVWVQAANPERALRPGTTVQVAMLARTVPNALTVPTAALLTDTASGATSVMVIGSDSKAHATDVTVGIRTADAVQILKGLQAGQRVVTVGAYGLADQTQVKVVPASAPAQDGGQ